MPQTRGMWAQPCGCDVAQGPCLALISCFQAFKLASHYGVAPSKLKKAAKKKGWCWELK